MAKYDPLRDYLLKYKGNELTLTFKQIEGVIGSDLPPSAYYLRQWWQNSWSPKRRHIQAVAWDEAGWKTKNVGFQSQRVTFCKKS